MKVRLAEIADRAGVSISTVSRVVNDKPGVNQHTRRLVLTAIDVLGYDRPARLRERVTGLIGLIVPELQNPFFPMFAEQVEHELSRHGYTPVLCSQTLGGVHEDDYVRMLLEHGVSGIIFVSGIHAIAESDAARYERLVDMGLPIALVNGYKPGVRAVCVSSDDAAVMELGVNHLVQMGHRRIGVALGQPRYTPVQRKIEGFVASMARHVPELGEAEVRDLVENTAYTVEGGALACRRLLQRGVTGILCGSDVMALGVIRAARQAGLRVPQDLSVVGSDDSLLIEFTDPPLTTVRQPTAALAQAACRALLEQAGGASPVSEEIVFQPELVVRSSTAKAREHWAEH